MSSVPSISRRHADTHTSSHILAVHSHFQCAFRFQQCAYATCHRPLPEPPSQSECGAGDLRGPPGPSGMSDCCCSCQGNRERRYDRWWHFLSFLHRMLCEKDGEGKERRKTRSWRVRLDEKSNDNNYGRVVLEQSPCLSIDCINIQWTVARLH